MAKAKKTSKVPSKANAMVCVTIGRGKNAKGIYVPVVVDFTKVFVYATTTPAKAVCAEAESEAGILPLKFKVVDGKTLADCYKMWRKQEGY